MAPFSQGYSHFQEAVYFLPLSCQKFLILILSTSEERKAESTLEQPSGSEHGLIIFSLLQISRSFLY